MHILGVKILRMGTSEDAAGRIAEGELSYKLVEQALSEALGEPVETIVRRAWPDPRLPGKFEEFLERYEPDLVFFKVPAYWVTYESVPLRMERLLGKLGTPVKDAGLKAAGTPWLAENFAFRALRRLANNTIGGATHFTPDQVAEVVTDCMRIALRREGTVVALRGPLSFADTATSAKVRKRQESRRLALHRACKELAARLHIDYLGSDAPVYLVEGTEVLLGDRLHHNQAGQRQAADQEVEFLMRAWERQRGPTPAIPASP